MKRIVLSILFFLVCVLLKAQAMLPASGGNVAGTGGSVSYSVGQVVYTTNSGANGSAAQGVQQPYEISIITALEQAKDINLICLVYPNPTTDFLTLKVVNYDKENLSYSLYDVSGNLLQNKKVEGIETQITVQTLLSGTYFLKVTDNSQEIKTFKIIKN